MRSSPSPAPARQAHRLASIAVVPPILQRKLVVGEANDPLEHEADRVADQIMQMPKPTISVMAAPPRISRACAACEEEEQPLLRTKRVGLPATPGLAPEIVHDMLKTPGLPLDPATRSFMEMRFGSDFHDVRIHSGPLAEASAQSVNALAYTVSRHIAFATGQYAPSSHEGRRLLAHELVHVLQQNAGSVGRPPPDAGGVGGVRNRPVDVTMSAPLVVAR